MRVEKVKNINDLPTAIENEIRQRKKEEFYDSFIYENDLYIVASLGQKNTSGYEVSIGNIIEVDIGKWEVMMKEKEPEKGDVLAQVITTPLIIARVVLMSKDKIIPKKIFFKNKKGEIINKKGEIINKKGEIIKGINVKLEK